MEDESKTQRDIAARLISALKEGGFVLYRQTIAALTAGAGARPFQEILIRFREEEEKLLPPGSFFPILEQYHLLPYVDRWVVSRLSNWARASRAASSGWVAPRNSINLSADTLRDSKFADFSGKLLQETGPPDEFLVFDIAWDTALLRADLLKKLQSQLKPAGCRFSLAGFDGSEASFSFLKEIGPDFVKFSYQVVKDIGGSLAAAEGAESINRRCHSMKIRTIAEYIETPEILERLKTIEVDFAQGFVIASPEPLL